MALQPKNITISHQHNTVIVFDFDDTLLPSKKLRDIVARREIPTCKCCSTFQKKKTIQQRLASRMTEQELKHFEKLSNVTYQLLLLYVQKYSKRNICIVTASKSGWVKAALILVSNIGRYSDIYHLLFNKKKEDINDHISIHHLPTDEYQSMQNNLYDEQGISRGFLWKHKMFQLIFNKKAKKSRNEIINTFVIIGDGQAEYDAAAKLREDIHKKTKNMKKYIFVHRIRLIDNPTINELIREQNLLLQICEREYYQKYSLLNRRCFDLNLQNETLCDEANPSHY